MNGSLIIKIKAPSGLGSAHLLSPLHLERTSGRLADSVYFVLIPPTQTPRFDSQLALDTRKETS